MTTTAATSDNAPRPNFDPLSEEQLLATLTDENSDVVKRAKALTDTCDAWDKVAVIETAKTAEALTEFLSQIGTCTETAETRRKAKKGVYDVCAKVVQKFFKADLMDGLETRATPLRKKLNTYLDGVRKAKEAEAKRLEDEARAKLAAAATSAEVKAATSDLKGAQKFAKSAGIKTDFGASAHQTMRWGFDIEDITKVPTKFMVIDVTAVMAFIRTGTPENPVTIPGLKVKRESGLSAG